MKQLIAVLVVMSGWCGGPACAAETETPAPAVQPTLTLTLTKTVIDLEKPSTARLKCVIRNQTQAAMEIPVGYDGRKVMLHSGLMTLHLANRRAEAQGKAAEEPIKLVTLQPGAEATVFDFEVDAVLLKGNKKRDEWRWWWDWPRRSAPPRSPLHPFAGVTEQLMFQAEIMLGEQRVISNFAVLKVKRRSPPPKTQHDITEAE